LHVNQASDKVTKLTHSLKQIYHTDIVITIRSKVMNEPR